MLVHLHVQKLNQTAYLRGNPNSLPKIQLAHIEPDVLAQENRLQARFLLALVVFEGEDDGFAEDDAGREVDQGHAAHGDVGEGPGGVHGGDGADENDYYADEMEAGHEFLAGHFLAVEVGEAVVNIEEVADEGREREERERYRDEDGAEAAEDCGEGVLDVGRAADNFGRDDAGAEAHEGCGGAEKECVDVDGKHLHEALLDRV